MQITRGNILLSVRLSGLVCASQLEVAPQPSKRRVGSEAGPGNGALCKMVRPFGSGSRGREPELGDAHRDRTVAGGRGAGDYPTITIALVTPNLHWQDQEILAETSLISSRCRTMSEQPTITELAHVLLRHSTRPLKAVRSSSAWFRQVRPLRKIATSV
jgi:hypothetical protein